MGQAGSTQLAPAPRRYQHGLTSGVASATLPHEPLRHAPKVLPSLETSPRLRCTDNGVILHSGGTISGRRALSATLPAQAHHAHPQRNNNQHMGVYRSRSASSGEHSPPVAVPDAPAQPPRAGRLTRERDPLHRSHTHLDLHDPLESATSKRFGSEPDLRIEEEQPKQRTNKHFRKKYKAPPPPSHQHDERDNSSPDSCEGNNRNAPARKLRLFKTRSETKKLNGSTTETKSSHCRNNRQPSTTVVNSRTENQSLERRYKPLNKEKDQFLKYPDSRDRDMVQSSTSLRIEENQLQGSGQRHDYRRCKNEKSNAYRLTANKSQDNTDTRNTPHLDRTFRYSERFCKKEEADPPVLRREKSFDATLVAKEREESRTMDNENLNRIKLIGDQLKNSRLTPLAPKDTQLRKSLPSLLVSNKEEKDKFQAELKRATNRIRNDIILNCAGTGKPAQETKTSQHDRNFNNKFSRNNPPNTKRTAPIQNIKVKVSSPKNCSISVLRQETDASKTMYNNDKRSPMRNNQTETKKLIEKQNALNKKLNGDAIRHITPFVRESRGLADRGQASGKESTPEQSPSRLKEVEKNKERENAAPSKQFYFGMIESKKVDLNEKVKDFPGLGSPIIEEYSNFHLIERKLLGYHDKEIDTDKFTRLASNDNNVKNVSSESALSSSEEEAGSAGSAESRDIALHLRPTLPKKQLEIPRFSPSAAWRQLAQIETEPADMQQTLAVEVKTPLAEPPAESPHRSDKSGDKSGDSGISGDHAHSDERLDSPPRPHVACGGAEPSTWTPLQDLEGDSGSDGTGRKVIGAEPAVAVRGEGLVTYSARGQPFSLSLPRDRQPSDKNKQFQQPFNSLQKLKKSVSGALGAALGSRRFDLEQEPILNEPSEQNWFLSKSAPNSLTNPLLYPHNSRPKGKHEGDIEEEPTPPASDQEDGGVTTWSSGAGGTGSGRNASYLSWGGHVMYLPPAPAQGSRQIQHTAQPLSLLLTNQHPERPTRSKSSGEIELRSRAARAARDLEGEMRERERSASPTHTPAAVNTSSLARALPARVVAATASPPNARGTSTGGVTNGGRSKAKRFTFQSTVRQLERRKIAEKLSREADLKEQQRRTELEAMRRVEEEFQRKRAREKASIRQQLRLVSGTTSLPPLTQHKQARDDPDGAVSPRGSPAPDNNNGEVRVKNRERREEDRDHRHSNASSEISGRSKSTTPVRCVELSEWREGGSGGGARQYRDWGAPPATLAHNIAHPPLCYRMPKSPAPIYLNANGKEAVDTFSGSPRSDNYRLEFARGVPRSPRTPRAPRHPLASRAPLATHSPSSSSSELSASVGGRQAIRLRESTRCGAAEPAIVPTLQPAPAAPRLRTLASTTARVPAAAAPMR